METTPPFCGSATFKRSLRMIFVHQARPHCRSYQANRVLPAPRYFDLDRFTAMIYWSEDIWKTQSSNHKTELELLCCQREVKPADKRSRQIKPLKVSHAARILRYFDSFTLDAEVLSPCALYYLSRGLKSKKSSRSNGFLFGYYHQIADGDQIKQSVPASNLSQPQLSTISACLLTHSSQSTGCNTTANV